LQRGTEGDLSASGAIFRAFREIPPPAPPQPLHHGEGATPLCKGGLSEKEMKTRPDFLGAEFDKFQFSTVKITSSYSAESRFLIPPRSRDEEGGLCVFVS